MKKILVVGAGFSGAVLARELTERTNCHVTVIDSRNHIGGNSHTERDANSQVMLHIYGPHIFHTSNEQVWQYVNRFTEMRAFVNRVKAVTPRGVFSMPINLMTINQFFGKCLNPEEAREFLAQIGDKSIVEPKNFEEQAMKFLGRDLYETFFKGYTIKQWGCSPTELSASILKRLPVRFNYDDNYYADKYQGIPVDGYTTLIANILKHPNIEVKLSTPFEHQMRAAYDHTFYSGPIDAFFNYQLGRLGYRTVYFERIDANGDYLGNAVLNYPNLSVPYTRVHEHKHFTPWEIHEKTVVFREYSKETEEHDTPYYPKNLTPDLKKLQEYQELAKQEKNITFIGRLGTYRYLDMDKTIAEALELGNNFCI